MTKILFYVERQWWSEVPEVVAGGGGGDRCSEVVAGGGGGRLPEVVVVAEGHFCHLEGIHGRNGEIHRFWEGMVNSLN